MADTSPELDFRAESAVVKDGSLIVVLEDGRTLHVPTETIPALSGFSDEQLANVRLIGRGIGVHWPELDIDLSVYRLFVPFSKNTNEAIRGEIISVDARSGSAEVRLVDGCMIPLIATAFISGRPARLPEKGDIVDVWLLQEDTGIITLARLVKERDRGYMFELTKEQTEKVEKWLEIVDPSSAHGAIGGAVTYAFTPTSLGIVTKVIFLRGTKHEQVLDLTDYDEW